MKFNFDQIIDRHNTNSVKWEYFPPDVLPFWVADTDFAVDPAIIQSIQKRLEHPIFGYSVDDPELINAIVQRMHNFYGWEIGAESVILVPGIVSGFNFAIRAVCKPGENIIFQTPAYPPFFHAPQNNQVGSVLNPMRFNPESDLYEIDFADFESKITPETKMFLLCNPQNPTGRVLSKTELERLGNICLERNLVICSDEIHSDIVYSGNHHIPIASLSPDLAQQSITFIAPSKTFNIPGLSCSAAIIQNEALRKDFRRALAGFSSGVSCLAQAAGLAAYTQGAEWHRQLSAYLEDNRNYLLDFVHREMPAIKTTEIQATFLSWMDCSGLQLPLSPQKFFEEKAKVGLNDGAAFGEEYENFVRLNFGTSRATLTEALEKMAEAINRS